MKSIFLIIFCQPAACRTGINCQGNGAIHFQGVLATANEQNSSDKEETPFLLQCITSHTKGESLEASFALMKHSVNLGD